MIDFKGREPSGGQVSENHGNRILGEKKHSVVLSKSSIMHMVINFREIYCIKDLGKIGENTRSSGTFGTL